MHYLFVVWAYKEDTHLDIVPNRNSQSAILLRETIRQDDKIIKRTLANLSSLTIEQAQQFRLIFKGKTLVEAQSHYEIIHSLCRCDGDDV